MSPEQKQEIVLETLRNINQIYRASGGNSLFSNVLHKSSNSEDAYIDLVSRVVGLAD